MGIEDLSSQDPEDIMDEKPADQPQKEKPTQTQLASMFGNLNKNSLILISLAKNVKKPDVQKDTTPQKPDTKKPETVTKNPKVIHVVDEKPHRREVQESRANPESRGRSPVRRKSPEKKHKRKDHKRSHSRTPSRSSSRSSGSASRSSSRSRSPVKSSKKKRSSDSSHHHSRKRESKSPHKTDDSKKTNGKKNGTIDDEKKV